MLTSEQKAKLQDLKTRLTTVHLDNQAIDEGTNKSIKESLLKLIAFCLETFHEERNFPAIKNALKELQETINKTYVKKHFQNQAHLARTIQRAQEKFREYQIGKTPEAHSHGLHAIEEIVSIVAEDFLKLNDAHNVPDARPYGSSEWLTFPQAMEQFKTWFQILNNQGFRQTNEKFVARILNLEGLESYGWQGDLLKGSYLEVMDNNHPVENSIITQEELNKQTHAEQLMNSIYLPREKSNIIVAMLMSAANRYAGLKIEYIPKKHQIRIWRNNRVLEPPKRLDESTIKSLVREQAEPRFKVSFHLKDETISGYKNISTLAGFLVKKAPHPVEH